MIFNIITYGAMLLFTGLTVTSLSWFIESNTVTDMLISIAGVIGVALAAMTRFIAAVFDGMLDDDEIEEDIYESVDLKSLEEMDEDERE